jgi:hypothetical protein
VRLLISSYGPVMTKKEKRDNARLRVSKKIVENVLYLLGRQEIVEGPRGQELLNHIEKEIHTLIFQYETKYAETDE